MRWAIEIQKTSLDDRMLSNILKELKLNLIQGRNFSKAFSGPEIDTCETSQDAIEVARKVRSALKIAEIDPEFSLGAVIDFSVDPPTSHHFLEVDSLIINVSFMPVTLTVSPPDGLSDEKKEEWIKNQEVQQFQVELNKKLSTLLPAYSNQNAAKVLELLSINPLTAQNIWKIYEYVRGTWFKGCDEHVQRKYGFTKDDFDRFKDRIHNKTVSGDYARHATDEKPNSNNPMSKLEAEAFIRNLAMKWLATIRQDFEKLKK